MPKHRIALFPGTFDPFTLGHLDIAERAARVFDAVEITIAANVGKEPLLPAETRLRLVQEATAHIAGTTGGCFRRPPGGSGTLAARRRPWFGAFATAPISTTRPRWPLQTEPSFPDLRLSSS